MTESHNKQNLENKKLELEIKQLEDTERSQAAIARHEAALRKLELERTRLELDEKKLAYEKLVDETSLRLAKRDNLTYRFTEEVYQKSVSACVRQLDLWSFMHPGRALEVVFTSPGGSVYEGLALFDHIRMLSRRGHLMITGTEGYAASMAGILLQAGDLRWVGQESWVLIHEVSSIRYGTTSDIGDGVEQMKRLQNRVIRIFLDRAEEAGAQQRLTEAQFKTRWKKTDWWLDSRETLDFGFVDEVR
jgi:ATP-dependent Clp protease protease subunit